MKVLLHNARRILDWQFVTRERAHPCTPRNVKVVKRRAFEHGMLSGGRRSHRRTTRSMSWNANANETAPLKGCVPPEALVCEWLLGNGTSGTSIGSNRSFGSPSVFLPENVIPSADAQHLLRRGAPLSRVYVIARFVCLRVSGAVAPSAPARGRSLPLQSEFWSVVSSESILGV